MEYIFSRIQVKSKQKKMSSPEMEHIFPPNSSTDLRSDAQQSQIIGGDADEDHTQIFWGDISSPSPGFRHPCVHD